MRGRSPARRCSSAARDVDGHVPLARVHESRDVLTRMGAAVTERIYPGMGHTVNADEIEHVRTLLAGIGAMP